MGSLLSKIQPGIESAAGSVTQILTGRKRKRADDDDYINDDNNDIIEKSLTTPKKKKLLSTPQYIYKALFKESKNADINVYALGKIWRLHKVYLCQSPYFASMFNGSWRESTADIINIQIVDRRITQESLSVVFGSLYLDEVVLEPKSTVAVLATARLFQLEGVIERCGEVMVETINAETAVQYYEAARQYGVKNVENVAFEWLLVNLLSYYINHPKWLLTINADLMQKLVEHSDLIVLKVEFSIYLLLKCWLYLKIKIGSNSSSSSNNNNNNYDINIDISGDDLKLNANKYFASKEWSDDNEPFLSTYYGKLYEKPFKALRLQHIVNHKFDLQSLLEDRIIPTSWLNIPVLMQWNYMLQIDQSIDKGPSECDNDIFYSTCLRCGRLLQAKGYQKWRWTGFNFGLDLILITDSGTLRIKRHHRSEQERLISQQAKRQFLIRVTVYSLNELRQIKHKQTTGIKALCLDKNEESSLLLMDNELEFPILIAVNLLVVTPNKQKISNNAPATASSTSQQTMNTNNNKSNEETLPNNSNNNTLQQEENNKYSNIVNNGGDGE